MTFSSAFLTSSAFMYLFVYTLAAGGAAGQYLVGPAPIARGYAEGGDGSVEPVRPVSAQGGGLFFYSFDVLVEGLGVVLAMPGNPVVGFRRCDQWTKDDAGMRQVLDLLARQRHSQAFRHKG